MLIKSAQNSIKELFFRQFAVFFGAGLSIHSGLPSAHSIISQIINKLPLDKREREEMLTTIIARLPFEAFMETLDGPTDIEPLLDIFEGAKPNRNHYLLAQLMISGKVNILCTTNFDDLLERALKKEGWESDKDYLLVSDLNSLETVNWDSRAPKVIKIHGSIYNKKGMAITLRQVASHQIFEPRKKAIEYLFDKGQHSHVLVVGYSCSDLFDISPQIESLPSKKM